MYDLISIGSITQDIFVLTERGKIFKTPQDKLAPAWLGFEAGEKICVDRVLTNSGGVATNLSIGTKKLGLKSAPAGPNEAAVSIIILDKKSGERVIFYEKSSGSVNLDVLKNAKTRWLSVSSLTGNWSREAGLILDFLKRRKAGLIVAPSTSMVRKGYKNLKRLLKGAEILILNRNEAIEIAYQEKKKTSSVNAVVKILHGLGPEIVCLTDGRKGAYCSDRQTIHHSPIVKVKTVDVTGAGDAFAAGFLGFYLKGATIKKALKAGIINSASVVRHVGTTEGLLSRREIERKFS